jgi:hypothetical protein
VNKQISEIKGKYLEQKNTSAQHLSQSPYHPVFFIPQPQKMFTVKIASELPQKFPDLQLLRRAANNPKPLPM